MYSEERKTETKTAPHQTTDTGELNVMSTKVVDDEDTQNDETLIYTYARVDTERVRKCSLANNLVTEHVFGNLLCM